MTSMADRNSKAGRNLSKRKSGLAQLPYLPYLFLRKLGDVTTFSQHIFRVVCHASHLQVVWINATRRIAFVHHHLPIKQRTSVQYPTNSVGVSVGASVIHTSIAKSVHVSDPYPTPVGFVDIPPKAISDALSAVVSINEPKGLSYYVA
jgi:hypothetical protein